MAEQIRLVIWDLDETFWRGTLTEGGITEYVSAHHDIVVELARRGIMNSICSKNTFAEAEDVLRDHGIWEYFVFPSIDWSPKGGRVAAIVEAMQLRPETVLFIDDNVQNRFEVEAAVPSIKTSDETILPTILSDEFFKGKDDVNLSRLMQYKLLEKRKADEKQAGSDNRDFLRGCDIRVEIDYDVEANIDRAVELINRTNQLNFTKKRLPDDATEAREALRKEISGYAVQAALIKVVDRYGDYGYTGFYLKNIDLPTGKGAFIHLCFSCRTLGMGVEQWLYQHLGSPPIKIEGEVVSSLNQPKVDWIKLRSEGATGETIESTGLAGLADLRFRGGCEVAALIHYFSGESISCVETSHQRDGIFLRYDCASSLLTDDAVESENAAVFRLAEPSQFLASAARPTALVVSLWGDMFAPLHLERNGDFEVNFTLQGMMHPVGGSRAGEFVNWSEKELESAFETNKFPPSSRSAVRAAVRRLRERFEYGGLAGRKRLQEKAEAVFDRIPDHCVLYLILPDPYGGRDSDATPRTRALTYIEAVENAARGRPNVVLVPIADCIHGLDDRNEIGDHFNRIVYFRIAEKLKTMMRQDVALQGAA